MESIKIFIAKYNWETMLHTVIEILFVLIFAWLLIKLVQKLLRRLQTNLIKNSKTEGEPPSEHEKRINTIIRLFRQGAFIAIWIITFMVILKKFGVDIAPIIAGAGIIGLALGFAFQDIASNFIAGVAITLQPRFNVGDLVEIDEIYGTVAQIDLRTTTIRTLNGQTVYVPNKDIFMNQVTDYTRKGIRRIELNVGVSYSDDLQQVKDLTLQAVYKVDTIEKEQPIDLYFEEFGDSSINLVVRYWVTFHTENDYLEARSQGIMLIKQTYDKHGITIPFPITTLDFMDNKTVKLTHKAKSK